MLRMCTYENPDQCCGLNPPLLWLIICNGLWSGVINCQLSLDPDVRVHLGKMSSGMLNIAHVLCTKQTLHWLITPGLHPSSVNNGSAPLAFIFCPCVSVTPTSLLFVIITMPERETWWEGGSVVAWMAWTLLHKIPSNLSLSIRLNQARLLDTA